MKLTHTLLLATFLLSSAAAYGQEVPKGVNYKRASDEVNALAKANLEAAFAGSDLVPADLFGNVVVVGPLLWKALRPSADQIMLDTKPVVIMVQVPAPTVAEGKRILTENERIAFWKLFRTTYTKLSESKIRKGNVEEISYYWATIPFDIEEPFWVVDTGRERFVAHFQVKEGKPRLFWIDLVGDLGTLKR
jgi:hypothetical protein